MDLYIIIALPLEFIFTSVSPPTFENTILLMVLKLSTLLLKYLSFSSPWKSLDIFFSISNEYCSGTKRSTELVSLSCTLFFISFSIKVVFPIPPLPNTNLRPINVFLQNFIIYSFTVTKPIKLTVFTVVCIFIYIVFIIKIFIFYIINNI
ncbi:hypothetical protein SDC9_85859 [bioreactor metagenome]|uniref:Uncharacterized protein n=1 Tax=bioreactor metagenome TaxID=1076179 RepID=A0A644ZED6_9ZZZZ